MFRIVGPPAARGEAARDLGVVVEDAHLDEIFDEEAAGHHLTFPHRRTQDLAQHHPTSGFRVHHLEAAKERAYQVERPEEGEDEEGPQQPQWAALALGYSHTGAYQERCPPPSYVHLTQPLDQSS